MSEHNRCNNSPQTISPEASEEMLRVPIPVIAPALVWIRILGERASTDCFRDTKDAIGVGDKSK